METMMRTEGGYDPAFVWRSQSELGPQGFLFAVRGKGVLVSVASDPVQSSCGSRGGLKVPSSLSMIPILILPTAAIKHLRATSSGQHPILFGP